jgi:hypothetical protein
MSKSCPLSILKRPRSILVLHSLSRMIRYCAVILPVGILGNVTFSLLSRHGAGLSLLAHSSAAYLAAAVVFSVMPIMTHSLRLLVCMRFLGPPLIGGSVIKSAMLISMGVSPAKTASVAALETLEDGLFFILAIPAALLTSAPRELAFL